MSKAELADLAGRLTLEDFVALTRAIILRTWPDCESAAIVVRIDGQLFELPVIPAQPHPLKLVPSRRAFFGGRAARMTLGEVGELLNQLRESQCPECDRMSLVGLDAEGVVRLRLDVGAKPRPQSS